MMTLGYYRTASHRKAISWMLMLPFLSLMLFPHYYHMHHVGDAENHDTGSSEHVIAIHGHSEFKDISHQRDGHTIKPAGDVSLKSAGTQLPLTVILVIFLLLLPVPVLAARQPPPRVMQRASCWNRHSTPPLRAPPRA
jgi:hypothetical protein